MPAILSNVVYRYVTSEARSPSRRMQLLNVDSVRSELAPVIRVSFAMRAIPSNVIYR